MDVNRGENENLVCDWGIENLGYGFSLMNLPDLLIRKSDEFTIKPVWFSRIVCDLRPVFANWNENHRQKGRA
jgi:hypothetical protein